MKVNTNTRPTASRAVRPLLILMVILAVALLGSACRPDIPADAGKVTDLPVGTTKETEVLGARIYLLRSEDDSVIAMWGMSPLTDAANNRVQCFVFKRSDRTVQGETGLFLDSCRGAWWSRDGRFLGYTGDPEGAPQPGPALIRIPTEIRDGRVELDLDLLKCLQDRRSDCL